MQHEIKTISLIGLGAMGSFFAPRLYEKFGDRFRIIADGSRKERLEKKGVSINRTVYHFPVVTPQQKGDPADLVIIATKGYSLDQAITDIRSQVGPDTQIMAVCNGVDAEEKLTAVYGAEHVLYSYMRVSIVMKDGVTEFDPALGAAHFGEKRNEEGHYTDRVLAVRKVMKDCGIPFEIDPDMEFGIWYKFACNVGENMTCALLGIPFGMFRTSDDANFLRDGGMKEVQAVAAARGITISDDDLARQDATVRTLPARNKPSTLQDIEAGRHTEVDMFAGTVMRLGKQYGIPTPICEVFCHGIHVLEQKNDLK